MRHSVVPAVLLAAGLLLAPAAAAHAAPCEGKFSCAPSEGVQDPLPTQPSLAPETDKKPTPKPEPTRVRETQVAPAPAAPEPTVEAPRPVATHAPVTVAPQPGNPASSSSEPVPTVDETVAPATPSASPSASPSPASPGPSKSSNWNTPVDKGKETQAAVLATSSFSGPNMLGLFGILGAVLLVGLGGLAFALWSKNRLSSH
ncbi:outer membrane biosynthesis protein TonB [Paenarthrobacter nitroguajacolicus]|uniref:hypothetical protein n=1 Tax=Paenarthrobacter nitroguajacolicus TaxID=211146 RepID=UPI002854A8FC|nr:hypothetical protein [Paenarthrobacter nitroguajacolicus]MDR6985748.1 outer membrane biosynthesis protein TonB [Paenarthrobacter nitroguajacolicus]